VRDLINQAEKGFGRDQLAEELGKEKLTPLLRLKYRNSLTDAIADLGSPAQISDCFVDFQRWLYTAQAA